MTPDSPVAAPLDDIRVVEVDNWMAAPSAAALMADLGADVIKIEPLAGDPMRGLSRPPKLEDADRKAYDYQYDCTNRGKRSIALDLTDDAAVDIVHQLVATADIFVCNLLPERQDRFRLDPATLQQHNDRLVHATFTGYGPTGPEAWRPGFDVCAFFGRSGLYDSLRTSPDAVVPMARPAQGDYTSGMALLNSVLAALRMAERTGEPQVVSTSLYQTAIWTMACDYAVAAVDKAPVRIRRRDQSMVATTNRYPCGDDKWLIIHMPRPSGWAPFCEAIERTEWIDHERFGHVRDRFKNMGELVPLIDDALSTRTRDEWGQRFDEFGVIWGPVLAIHEVAEDPQAHALGMFPLIESPEIGEYRTVAPPINLEGSDVGPRGPAPGLGQHTAEILESLGIDGAQVNDLVARGIVGSAVEG